MRGGGRTWWLSTSLSRDVRRECLSGLPCVQCQPGSTCACLSCDARIERVHLLARRTRAFAFATENGERRTLSLSPLAGPGRLPWGNAPAVQATMSRFADSKRSMTQPKWRSAPDRLVSSCVAISNAALPQIEAIKIAPTMTSRRPVRDRFSLMTGWFAAEPESQSFQRRAVILVQKPCIRSRPDTRAVFCTRTGKRTLNATPCSKPGLTAHRRLGNPEPRRSKPRTNRRKFMWYDITTEETP